MTAVAETAGCAGYPIGTPLPVGDVPLCRERRVVVTNLPEVALFPFAAVDESDLVFGERHERIGLREVRHDRVRVLARIADDVRHPGSPPTIVDGRVAAGARLGTHVGWRGRLRLRAGEEERTDPHDQNRAQEDHANDLESASNIAMPCSSSAPSSLCICRSPSTSFPTAGASGRL